jgi:hypothetical protein
MHTYSIILILFKNILIILIENNWVLNISLILAKQKCEPSKKILVIK